MKQLVVFAAILGLMGTSWGKPPRKAAAEPKVLEVAYQGSGSPLLAPVQYVPSPTPLGNPPVAPGTLAIPPLPNVVPPSTGGALIQQPIPQSLGQSQYFPQQLGQPQYLGQSPSLGQPYLGAPQMMAPQRAGIILDPGMVQPVALYTNVKIVEPRNMAPCAIPKIVSVPDPCNPGCCVFIAICVPPGACENVFYRPLLDRTVFEYGKYRVKVTNRKGQLVVNYDD